MFVALGIQHAKHVCHIVIRGLTQLYNIFPHYVINGMIFEKNRYWKFNGLWFSLHLLSETFLIPRRIERGIITSIYWFPRKGPVILEFSWQIFFSKNTQIPNFVIIRPVGAEMPHVDGWTDGQTDMTKLIVTLRNFLKEPNLKKKYIASKNI